MIVKTMHSVYKVEEHEGSPRFSIEKIKDLPPGNISGASVGEIRYGNALKLKVGSDMILSERTDGHDLFWTTTVVEVIP